MFFKYLPIPNASYTKIFTRWQGKTKRKYKDRLAEHRDYLKRDIKSEPSGSHFTKHGHNVSHLKGLVLEQVRNSDPFILKTQEHLLIQKFNTFRHGLNQEP